MMAEKSLMPIMPRFDTLKVEPVISSTLSLRSRARRASSWASVAIWPSVLTSALRMTGVTRPSSMATAMPMSTRPWRMIPSSLNEALASGTRRSARAAALMTRSLTDSLAPWTSLTCSRKAMALSMSTSAVR